MKRNLNRGISLLLTVCLVLGMFAGSGLTLVRAEDVENAEQLPITLPNLIANGTFGGYRDVTSYTANKVPASWSGTNTSKLEGENYLESTNRYVYDGNYAIHAVANKSAVAFSLGQTFVFADHGISAGDTLTMTAYVRGSVTASGANFKLDVRGGANAKAFNTSYTYKNVSNEWTKIEVTAEVPEGTTSVVAQPLYVGKATVFDIYIDNVVLTLTKKDTGVVSDLGLKNASFETLNAEATATTTTELFKDFSGWVAGGADYGTVSAEVDPADANNVVLMLNDTSAQPKDESGNPIQDTNKDGTPKVDADGNPVWKQGNYPAAYYGGFAVEVGKTYTFSLKYKAANVEDGQTLAVNLRGNASSSSGIRLNSDSAKNLTTEWQTLTISTKEIPAGVETFYVAINTAKDPVGIVYIDDVTLTLDCEHKWAGNACENCGATCQHKVEAGVCTICGEEFPATVIPNNLVTNGTFDANKGTVTNYILTKDAHCSYGGWVLGGNAPTSEMYVGVSNAWASEGNWSTYLYDNDESKAISINMYVPAPGSTPETEIFVAADYAGIQGSIRVTAVPYVKNAEGKFVQVMNAEGKSISAALGTIEGDGHKQTTKTIDANYDWLQFKIATGGAAFAEGYLDNVVVKVNGSENLLSNASFETLPVGVKPAAGEAGAFLDAANWEFATDGVHAIEFESEGSNNGVLHVKDATSDFGGSATTYPALKANTKYILSWKYKYVEGKMPSVFVRETLADGTRIDIVKYAPEELTAGEWKSETIEFTTGSDEATRTLFVNSAVSSLGEAYFDDFVLIEVCNEHDFELVEVTEASCIAAGYRNVACVTCGATGTTQVAEKNTEHVWADANCVSPKYCTVCGCGETEGEALGHTWVDGVCSVCTKPCVHTYVNEAGESTNGICFICGMGCAHEYDDDQDATCNICGVEREVEPAGCGDNHSWNEGEVTTAPDKTTTGIMTYTCTACGETKTEEIPPLLRFSGAALTLLSNVQVNFNVTRATLDTYGYTDLYAVFTYVNRDNKLITVTLTEYRKTDKNYVFDFDELAPDLFGNTITATLYAKNNGKDYVSATVEYSVLQYCNKQLPGAKSNPTFRAVLVDLLNYGAATQLYTGYKTDALVNAGLTEEQKSWGGTASGGYTSHQAITGDVEAPLAAWKGGALVLEDAVTMTVTIEAADLEGLSVKVNCGKFEFNYDCVVDPEAEEQIFVPAGKENRYKLYINELPVYSMREPVYMTVYKDGVPVSQQLTYSVESYAASKYGSKVELTNLIDAMMRYGDAVDAYATAMGAK